MGLERADSVQAFLPSPRGGNPSGSPAGGGTPVSESEPGWLRAGEQGPGRVQGTAARGSLSEGAEPPVSGFAAHAAGGDAGDCGDASASTAHPMWGPASGAAEPLEPSPLWTGVEGGGEAAGGTETPDPDPGGAAAPAAEAAAAAARPESGARVSPGAGPGGAASGAAAARQGPAAEPAPREGSVGAAEPVWAASPPGDSSAPDEGRAGGGDPGLPDRVAATAEAAAEAATPYASPQQGGAESPAPSPAARLAPRGSGLVSRNSGLGLEAGSAGGALALRRASERMRATLAAADADARSGAAGDADSDASSASFHTAASAAAAANGASHARNASGESLGGFSECDTPPRGAQPAGPPARGTPGGDLTTFSPLRRRQMRSQVSGHPLLPAHQPVHCVLWLFPWLLLLLFAGCIQARLHYGSLIVSVSNSEHKLGRNRMAQRRRGPAARVARWRWCRRTCCCQGL